MREYARRVRRKGMTWLGWESACPKRFRDHGFARDVRKVGDSLQVDFDCTGGD